MGADTVLGLLETTSCAGARPTRPMTGPNDGARDVIDCGENAGEDETTPDNDADIYTPGVDEINNCEKLREPESARARVASLPGQRRKRRTRPGRMGRTSES
jgi:hypothetical protein